MLSEFQTQKVRHFFTLFDADRDGFLEQSDVETIVRNVAAAQGWSAGAPGYDALHQHWLMAWAALQKVSDQNRDNVVSFDEWLKLTDALLASEDGYTGIMEAIGQRTFDALDVDGDGQLTLNDWRIFLRAHHLDESAADAVFPRLDANADGRLSRAEAMAHLRDFFYSDEPQTPGNYFFGPL